MSGLQAAVAAFLAERDDFIRALNNCTNANSDYWGWQGHAAARRQLREALERAGIDLTAEPAPVANRELVAEALEGAPVWGPRDDEALPLASFERRRVAAALLAADVFRDEAKVKAEALEEAGRLIRDEHGQYDASEMLHEQAAALLAGGDQ